MGRLVALLCLGVTVCLLQGSATPAGEKGPPPQVKPADGPPAGGKGGGPAKVHEDPKEVVLKGKITKNDPLDTVRTQSHCKVHTLTLQGGYAYVIDMKADPQPGKDLPSFDTYLRLEDAAGKQLATNDDFITTNSRLVYSPEKTAEFRLICTTFDAGFTGSYTLTLTAHRGAVDPTGGIQVFKIDGKLTKDDPFDTKRTTSHAKVHTVKMVKGKSYQIDMTSMQFLTFVRVEDPKGKQIAERDDQLMGGLNTQLSVTPKETGDYRIIAMTFQPNQIGAYVLKVTQR